MCRGPCRSPKIHRGALPAYPHLPRRFAPNLSTSRDWRLSPQPVLPPRSSQTQRAEATEGRKLGCGPAGLAPGCSSWAQRTMMKRDCPHNSSGTEMRLICLTQDREASADQTRLKAVMAESPGHLLPAGP